MSFEVTNPPPPPGVFPGKQTRKILTKCNIFWKLKEKNFIGSKNHLEQFIWFFKITGFGNRNLTFSNITIFSKLFLAS
jgi:hypothetical protein